MRAEKEIAQLEEEVKAIKASFQQSASMMEVYKAEMQFATSQNLVQWNGNGHWEPFKYELLESLTSYSSDAQGNHTGYGYERIVITFDCEGGQNTFASLELDMVDVNEWAVWYKRIPYSGGARWVVSLHPNGSYNGQGTFIWRPSVLKIAVESAIPGTLGAKMIWQ